MRIIRLLTAGKRFKQEKMKADQGDASAQYLTGFSYENGTSVERDYEEAYRYFKLAADQGHAAAQASLGRLYENGNGVEQDYEKAYRYYKIAADQRDDSAYAALGRFYEFGYWVEQNYDMAYRYYKLAGKWSYEAESGLERLHENGYVPPQEVDKSSQCSEQVEIEEDIEAVDESTGEVADSYVFISYSTKNQMAADAVNNLLQEEGIKTWMAPYGIPAGSKYAQVINHALKDCACLILILSNDAQNSTWVGKEVERAINYKKSIVPIQIEDVILNDEFEFYISTDQIVAVQKIDKDSKEIQNVLASVKALTNV